MDCLHEGQELLIGQQITSESNRFRFVMQGDGNAVRYDRDFGVEAAWATGTDNSGATRIVMQRDGNLCVYDSQAVCKWASDTWRHGKGGGNSFRLVMQNDGNLVIYKNGAEPIWSSNTEMYWRLGTLDRRRDESFNRADHNIIIDKIDGESVVQIECWLVHLNSKIDGQSVVSIRAFGTGRICVQGKIDGKSKVSFNAPNCDIVIADKVDGSSSVLATCKSLAVHGKVDGQAFVACTGPISVREGVHGDSVVRENQERTTPPLKLFTDQDSNKKIKFAQVYKIPLGVTEWLRIGINVVFPFTVAFPTPEHRYIVLQVDHDSQCDSYWCLQKHNDGAVTVRRFFDAISAKENGYEACGKMCAGNWGSISKVYDVRVKSITLGDLYMNIEKDENHGYDLIFNNCHGLVERQENFLGNNTPLRDGDIN
ncbi:hypothetical protein HK100_000813 [Physocladia obscura]|uniref:Bulb-type lectin domain-containing protein n=1 Tax=Physocladia obscura TaxID=109957 RepID=A0AAD5XFC3_9FUNG|nr:hypothetical protein HK100_000813 [Physocladia obscura]